MIFVFTSMGCPACHQLIYDIKYDQFKDWASHVKFVDVKFNEQEQCNKAYIDGSPTDGPAPVDAVPAIYFTKSEEVIYGYENIKERLLNGNK